MALFLATRHFRFLLEGRKFTDFMDHKPLTFAVPKTTELWSAQQQRHLSAISEFTTDIRHVASKNNLMADCLSRAQVGSVHLGVDYSAMAADQLVNSVSQAFRSVLLCDVSTGQPYPMVPAGWRRCVFDGIRALSHPSVRALILVCCQT